MSTKEMLVDLLQKSGYDLLSACEYADNVIQEIKALPKGIYTYHVGIYTVQIKRK